MQESYKVKKVVVEAVGRTAVAMGTWECRWGDISARVPDITPLKSEAQLLSTDHRGGKLKLLQNRPNAGFAGPVIKRRNIEKDLSSCSSASSSTEDGSQADAAEAETARVTNEAMMTTLATSKSKASQIHLLSEEDTGDGDQVMCLCGRRLRRSSAEVEVALYFNSFDRKPCDKCRKQGVPSPPSFGPGSKIRRLRFSEQGFPDLMQIAQMRMEGASTLRIESA